MEKMSIHYIIRIKCFCLLFLFIVSVSSCKNKQDHRDKLRESLIIEKHGTNVELHRKLLIKIYFKERKYKILRAYIDCLEPNREVDPISYRIKDCFKQLEIRNDTIRIVLTPTNLGKKKFEDITIVCEDQRDRISLIDTSFYYTVVVKK